MTAAAKPAEKATGSDVRFWPTLATSLRPHRRRLALLSGFALVGAATELAVIALIATATERVISPERPSTIDQLASFSNARLLTIATVVALLKVALDLVQVRLEAASQRRFEAGLRREIAHAHANCRWEIIEDAEPGSVQSMMWSSVAQARSAYGSVMSGTGAVSRLSLMLAAAAVAAGWLSMGVVLGIALFAFVFRPLSQGARRAGMRLRAAMRRYGAQLNEDITMSREIRVMGISELVADRLADAGDEVAEAGARQLYLSRMLGIAYGNAVYLLAIVGFVAINILGSRNPGALAALVLLLYRSMNYGASVQASIQALHGSVAFLADVNEWLEEFQANPESRSGNADVPGFERLVFEDVGLVYSNGTAGLKGVDVDIRAGEAIAVVGPSGSGKSSFVSLVLGLRDATSGRVLVNGTSMEEVSKLSWRTHVALVAQESRLFDGSVSVNVDCWRGLGPDRVRDALAKAHVLDQVEAMPGGIDGSVGDGGGRLSGGQRQRVCLARALAGGPALLVLDEPTSSLDALSEQAVKQTLEQLKGEVTLIIVAHRLSTISICDRVLVFADGRVVDDGRPDEVVSSPGFLAQAMEIQELRRDAPMADADAGAGAVAVAD